MRAGGGLTAGTIVSIKGNVIVVKNQQGKEVTVSATATTTLTGTVSIAIGDLRLGDTVAATGQPDSSGNVTALTISKDPLALGGGGAGAGRPTPTPTK
jgi:hypothetical protein